MFVNVKYYVRFGRGDASEVLDWNFELTDEEADAYNKALGEGTNPSDSPILEEALNRRAYEEITEAEADNLREMYIDCFGDELEENEDSEDDDDDGPVVTKEMIFDRWSLYLKYSDDKEFQ